MHAVTKIIFLVLASTYLLTGCEVKKNYAVSSVEPVKQEDVSSDEKEDLAHCEQELNVLKDIDNEKYINLNAKFERMIKGAAGYSRVRGGLNQSTQGAIDALYHYSATKVCTEIRAETLDALSSKPGV